MRIRRVLAATFAALILGATMGAASAMAAPPKGLPPIGDKCAMQEYLGIQNVRACEDETS